jgi:hypothetical protein
MEKVDFVLASLLGATVVASCSNNTSAPVCGPDNVATTNADVVAAVNAEAAWYYASLDPIVFSGPLVAAAPVGRNSTDATGPSDAGISLTDAGLSAASNAAASAVAAAAGNYFPNACATVTASGNVVTFTMDLCSGPLGLVASSGILTATLNVAGNTVQVQLAGNNIIANGGTVNVSTSGTFTVINGQKTLHATSQSTGTGLNGNSVTHMGSYTLVWPTGTGCATLNGSFSGIGSGTYSGTSTQITSFVTCTNQCPQSGTTFSTFNGGSVTFTFNGTNNAQCTASNGANASVSLVCP